MNHNNPRESSTNELRDRFTDDDNPLKKVEWTVEIDGPLLTYRSKQIYMNQSDDVVEINYNFPLPYGKSVISRFKATVNGVTRTAKALPKREAEERYEDAIESGDAPIMLEIVEKDFCTASLGNIKPGEKAEIELEYFRFIPSCGNKIRVAVPTVIDQRYQIDPTAYLRGRYEAYADFLADYDCEGTVYVRGNNEEVKLSSPTHPLIFSIENGVLKAEIKNAKLDRDLVLDIDAPRRSGLYLAKDGDRYAAVSVFAPEFKAKKQPYDLSILVDCSSSMRGSRIDWVQKALREFSKSLRPEDSVSLIRFGSKPEPALMPPKYRFEGMNNSVIDVINQLEADLGGTELEKALDMCWDFFPAESDQSAILLLTDGEVWTDIEKLVEKARLNKRKIFVLGIGLAPYHNLLGQLAQKTGGAFESVYNEEDTKTAVKRMVKRMRSVTVENARTQWNVPTIWESRIEDNLFASDSVITCAFLKEKPEIATLSWSVLGQSMTTQAAVLCEETGFKLCQLVAHQEMLASKDPKQIERIALHYNLAGPETNFFLVVERAAEDKTEDAPVLKVLPQMAVADRTGSIVDSKMLAEVRQAMFDMPESSLDSSLGMIQFLRAKMSDDVFYTKETHAKRKPSEAEIKLADYLSKSDTFEQQLTKMLSKRNHYFLLMFLRYLMQLEMIPYQDLETFDFSSVLRNWAPEIYREVRNELEENGISLEDCIRNLYLRRLEPLGHIKFTRDCTSQSEENLEILLSLIKIARF